MCDQCRFGLTSIDSEGPGLVKKSTKFITNSKVLAKALSRRCKGGHRHVHLLNGRAAAARVYPQDLCKTVASALKEEIRAHERQYLVQHLFLPESVPEAGTAQEICSVTPRAVVGMTSRAGGSTPRQ